MHALREGCLVVFIVFRVLGWVLTMQKSSAGRSCAYSGPFGTVETHLMKKTPR